MAGRDAGRHSVARSSARAWPAYPGGTFAPFTAQEWTGLDYEGALACLRWPPAAFPDPPVPPSAPYPNVPTLILNGDLDNITPLADARVVAARFPRSTLVVMQNSGHVTALQDQNDCAAPIYEHFVRTLERGRHVVRGAHARGAGRAVVPAHARGCRPGAAVAGRRHRPCATAGWRPRAPPPLPTPCSAGGRT